MGVQSNAYPLRIDPAYMDKLRVIAKKNGRSINKEIEMLIKASVDTFEAHHGEISEDEIERAR